MGHQRKRLPFGEGVLYLRLKTEDLIMNTIGKHFMFLNIVPFGERQFYLSKTKSRPEYGSERDGLSVLLLFLDDLEAREFLSVLLVERVGDELDVALELGDHDVLERVGTLLGLLDGDRQSIDAVLDLGELHRQVLGTHKERDRLVESGVGMAQTVVQLMLIGLLDRQNRDLDAHDGARIHRHAVVDGDSLRELVTEAEGDIRFLQGNIRVAERCVDGALNLGRTVDQRHHLADEDIALFVEQLIADPRQRQGFLDRHQITFGRYRLLCHSVTPFGRCNEY